ncbi:uncharacterized protein LOC131721200 [Acipenser ruthenus]|uniref:uncharacterized protein LOC131721200 n=1 Tax=Acipenser ruthenus TaxID=7906 RepID=UPI0027427DDA|nr:uncharacterized protein LOC131721200 [Acipenser ruthenus]
MGLSKYIGHRPNGTTAWIHLNLNLLTLNTPKLMVYLFPQTAGAATDSNMICVPGIMSFQNRRGFHTSGRGTRRVQRDKLWGPPGRTAREYLDNDRGVVTVGHLSMHPTLPINITGIIEDAEEWMKTINHTAKNLGVTLDPCLSYSQHISTLARTCRFFLSNIRRIRPFLTNYATQLLVQALVLSRLDYCNSLLAGLPASATRPLQLIQNSAARLVFSLPRFAHATPLLSSLHWLPITARIQFKTLVLAYRCLDQTAPSYLQTLITPYTPTRPLRSACTRRLALPPLRSPASRARSFSTLAPQWWNDLPTDVRTAQSLTTFRRLLKTHLFKQHL